jgi:RNA polymerase sigma-70 factor (ECF subfamily)
MLEQSEPKGIGEVRERAMAQREEPLAYLDDVVRYAFARLGSREEAEDVAMEVFQAAFRLRKELPNKANPRLYLIGIARRKIADQARRYRRQRGPVTVSLDDPSAAEIGFETSSRIPELMQALDTLPELQRDALILKYLHGFSVSEVSALIRKSPEAVNSLLQRGREALAKRLVEPPSELNLMRRMP